MKNLCVFLFLVIGFHVQAQKLKTTYKENLVGFNYYNDDEVYLSSLAPNYQDLYAFVKTSLGDVFINTFYGNCRELCDTEFIDVSKDPNDPSLTKTDTIPYCYKTYFPDKPILAKQNNKWGLINHQGKILLPLHFDEVSFISKDCYSRHNNRFLFKKGETYTLMDDENNLLIDASQFPQYFNQLKRKEQALQISLFGNYLLVCEGGILADTFEIVINSDVKKTKSGYIETKRKSSKNNYYYYKGGKFNVINLSTGEFIWAEPKSNIEVSFTDNKNNKTFENLNPRNLQSIILYNYNMYAKGHENLPITINFNEVK